MVCNPGSSCLLFVPALFLLRGYPPLIHAILDVSIFSSHHILVLCTPPDPVGSFWRRGRTRTLFWPRSVDSCFTIEAQEEKTSSTSKVIDSPRPLSLMLILIGVGHVSCCFCCVPSFITSFALLHLCGYGKSSTRRHAWIRPGWGRTEQPRGTFCCWKNLFPGITSRQSLPPRS